jgi:hypothetical protein
MENPDTGPWQNCITGHRTQTVNSDDTGLKDRD